MKVIFLESVFRSTGMKGNKKTGPYLAQVRPVFEIHHGSIANQYHELCQITFYPLVCTDRKNYSLPYHNSQHGVEICVEFLIVIPVVMIGNDQPVILGGGEVLLGGFDFKISLGGWEFLVDRIDQA